MGAVDRAEVAARFSKVIRSGRWVAGRRIRLTAHFGALIVNLADAVLPGREITLEIDAFCGKLILTVPAGAHVIDEGGALFAKRAVYGRQDPGDADGPVIRLVGEARFSKVAVHRELRPARPAAAQVLAAEPEITRRHCRGSPESSPAAPGRGKAGAWRPGRRYPGRG